MNISKTKANTMMRVGAALIDIFIFIILNMLLSSLVISPIIAFLPDYQTNYTVYSNKLVESKMYVEDDDGSIIYILNDYSRDDLSTYDQIIVDNYSKYSATDEIVAFQNSKGEEGSGFVKENDSYVPGTDDEKLQVFYNNAFNDVSSFLLQNDQELATCFGKLNFYSQISNFTSVISAALIVYLLFPFVFKNGQTLGKKFLKLYVVDADKDDRALSKGRLLLRQSSFIVVEIVLSQFTYYIPLVISLIVMLVSKNKVALHDLIARTVVLDDQSKESDSQEIDKRIKVTPPLNDVDKIVKSSEIIEEIPSNQNMKDEGENQWRLNVHYGSVF